MIGFSCSLKQGIVYFCWHHPICFLSWFDESFVFSQIFQINLKKSIKFNFLIHNYKNWKKSLTMTTRAMATPITIAKKTPKAKKLWIIGLLLRDNIITSVYVFISEIIWRTFEVSKGSKSKKKINKFFSKLSLRYLMKV